MDPIFGNNKELLKEYRFLVNEILPSLNDCRFCNKLKCKYCKKFCVNCNMCIAEKCLNCHRFNKSKDILINKGDDFVSNYIKDFFHDYFKVSDLINFFLNMDINQIVKEKDPTNVDKFENDKADLPPPPKKEKKIFILKVENIDIIVNLFKKKVFGKKKLSFFL